MASDTLIQVEVAYALPDHQVIIPLDVPLGSTVEDAVRASGILDTFSEIDLSQNKVGVFGKLTKLDAELRAKDRVEIYRPLIADPKEARKRRAAEHADEKSREGD
jgi:putative ubiquitin-RnfH superfamily antitoxin RatB of RatAB toxin-antitoxin module